LNTQNKNKRRLELEIRIVMPVREKNSRCGQKCWCLSVWRRETGNCGVGGASEKHGVGVAPVHYTFFYFLLTGRRCPVPGDSSSNPLPGLNPPTQPPTAPLPPSAVLLSPREFGQFYFSELVTKIQKIYYMYYFIVRHLCLLWHDLMNFNEDA
jgi:hypothetical protein